MILHGLFFVVPAVLEGFVALRLTDNPAWLDAASDEHIRVNGAPMIPAEVQIHLRIPTEFMAHHNHGFIQQCLSWFLARHAREMLNQASQCCIQPWTALVDGQQEAPWSYRATAIDLIMIIRRAVVSIIGIGNPYKSGAGVGREEISGQ